jgi:uncharacterized protein (TIRG00374 family)
MKKFLIILLKYVIAFGIGIALIWWSLRDITVDNAAAIKDIMRQARYWLIAPVFILLLFSHYIRALRWKQIIEPMGYHPPVFDLLCGILIGYIGNQLIPRAGEILRCTVISKEQKIPVEKLLGTIIAERMIDILCLALLSCFIFFIEYEYVHVYASQVIHSFSVNLFQGNKLYHWLIVLFAIALIFVVVSIIKKRSKRWGSFFTRLIQGLWQGSTSMRNLKRKWLFIAYTLLIWLCYISATWVGCFALQQTHHLGITTSIAMLVFGSFGIIIAPGGLGAYPFAIQKTLMYYGIQYTVAIAFGWLLWLAQFMFTIIFGAIAYIAINIKSGINEKHSIGSA